MEKLNGETKEANEGRIVIDTTQEIQENLHAIMDLIGKLPQDDLNKFSEDLDNLSELPRKISELVWDRRVKNAVDKAKAILEAGFSFDTIQTDKVFMILKDNGDLEQFSPSQYYCDLF